MQIELNGMHYIVSLHMKNDGPMIVAEIVDEAFARPVQRAEVSGIDGVIALIRQYSGQVPPRSQLHRLAAALEEHLDTALGMALPGRSAAAHAEIRQAS